MEAECEEHSERQQKDTSGRQNASAIADFFEMHFLLLFCFGNITNYVMLLKTNDLNPEQNTGCCSSVGCTSQTGRRWLAMEGCDVDEIVLHITSKPATTHNLTIRDTEKERK